RDQRRPGNVARPAICPGQTRNNPCNPCLIYFLDPAQPSFKRVPAYLSRRDSAHSKVGYRLCRLMPGLPERRNVEMAPQRREQQRADMKLQSELSRKNE